MYPEIPILYQNSDIIVVDKPVGISIHNTEDAFNLIEAVQRQVDVAKVFPVHRLDKETSGIQIFALNESAARQFADQFQTRNVVKLYLGVLRGSLKSSSDGVWSHPLSDKSEGRLNPAGLTKDRVECETRYRILQSSKFFTKCEFNLITGRQHQIRKHAAITGHALVGDSRYGDQKYNRRMSELYRDNRMYLHCCGIDLLGKSFASTEPIAFQRLFTAS